MDEQTNGTQQPNVEERARSLGWQPKEEFRGDPARWVSAATYIQRGEDLLPLVKAENRKLEEELGRTRAQLTEQSQLLRGAQASIEALKEFNTEANRQQAERIRAQLIREMSQAREDGEIEKEVDLQGRIRDQDEAIRKAKEGKAKPEAANGTGAINGTGTSEPRNTPEFQQFVKDNDWFEKNRRMRAVAVDIAAELAESGRLANLTPAQRLGLVAEETKKYFAEAGGGRTSSKVEGGSAGSGSVGGGAQTYDALPQDAKDACEKFASRMVGPGKAYKDASQWRKAYVDRYYNTQMQ